MRKLFYVFVIVCTFVAVCSCSDSPKQCKGVVRQLTDSTMSFVASDDVSVLIITDADYPNGKIMSVDSAIITYKGRLSSGKAKAEIIYLIPPKGNVIDLKQLQEQQKDSALKTRPADPETRRKFKEFLKMKH